MPAPFAPPPGGAAWHFSGVRRGAETVVFTRGVDGVRAVGRSRGIDLDDGVPWRVHYDIRWDHGWRLRSATVRGSGLVRRLERDDTRGWTIDGAPHPEFADCVDLDLQVSLLTNTAPVRRARGRGAPVDATAVYLTSTLALERLPQSYRRLPGAGHRFAYDSPVHDYRAVLRFGADGLVLDYPFLGRRAR